MGTLPLTTWCPSDIVRKYIFAFLFWSLLAAMSLAWNIQQEDKSALSMATVAARASLRENFIFREWMFSHSDIYVSSAKRTPLGHQTGRQADGQTVLLIAAGKELIKLNPAYALRDLQAFSRDGNGVKNHLTSLKLVNPKNSPDAWEVAALKRFEQGDREVVEVQQLDGQPYLRLMQPLLVRKDCLECHDDMGYKIGDVRGGICSSIALRPYQLSSRVRITKLSLSYGAVWLVGVLGMGVSYRRQRSLETERVQMEEQVRKMAFYDALTQLPNRRLLNDRLGQIMSASKRSHNYGALMFLDLDNFKPLNDTHGHVMGDLLLIEAARRLEGCVREMDTVARFGGDEFVVILAELDEDKNLSTEQAKVVAEKIRAALAEPYLLRASNEESPAITVEHHCTASIGVALFVNHESSQDDILNWADDAMYEAKNAGRNQIRFYDAKA